MRKRLLLICLMSVSVLPTLSYARLQEHSEHSDHKEIWTCPMHPQVKQDKPGNCPICGMRLVLKKVSEPQKGKVASQDDSKRNMPKDHVAIRLSLEKQQKIGVKTTTVVSESIVKKISTVGRIAFDPELYSAQNDLVEALRNFDNIKKSPIPSAIQSAKHMIESAELRLRVLGIAEDQIRQLERSKTVDASVLVNHPGGKSWIYADIFESDLGDIRPGLEAEISASYLKGTILRGKIASIDRVIEPDTRTAKARIMLAPTLPALRPQSYVDVSIAVPLGEKTWVPSQAVLNTGKEAWVFVTDGSGYFEPRLIKIEAYVGDKVIVASGLQVSEKIVLSANFLIDSESRLRSVLTQTAVPNCPEGQSWDVGMSMCM